MSCFFRLGIIYIFLQVLVVLRQLSFCNSSEVYTAAVLEHVRFGDLKKHSASEIIQNNLEIYKSAVETASKNNADIIVFPECGLFPPDKRHRETLLNFAEDIPDPKSATWNPCDQEELFIEQKILRTLSCFARINNIYIVANLVDIKVCKIGEGVCFSDNTEKCPVTFKECKPDNLKFFNTNVVFDRNGTLISRYYKQHLFFEPDKDIPDDFENAYFETDFGLFTTFVCFDICFKNAVNAIKEKRIKNVAYPTYWFDTFPYATAIQYHQAWAIRNKVNLLSANCHYPGTGTIGSAIYSGSRGALIYTFDPNGISKLLISEVPKDPENPKLLTRSFKNKTFYLNDSKFIQVSTENQSNVLLDYCSWQMLGKTTDNTTDYRCYEMILKDGETALKKLQNKSDNLEICINNLCCSLNYSASFIDEDYYLLADFSMKYFSGYGLCYQSCFLVRCDSTTKPCNVYPLKTKTKFKTLELKGNFTAEYVYPSVLKSNMKLGSTSNWYYENGQIIYSDLSLKGETLISVGLTGRCYDNDLILLPEEADLH